MIKIAILLIFLAPSLCFAEVSGYLFLGKYLNHKQVDLEGREINYKAGIYLEKKTKWTTFFLREETLIRDLDEKGAFPKQINYTIGIKHEYKSIEIIMSHTCLHPIDGNSGGKKATDYDFIEGRIKFF